MVPKDLPLTIMLVVVVAIIITTFAPTPVVSDDIMCSSGPVVECSSGCLTTFTNECTLLGEDCINCCNFLIANCLTICMSTAACQALCLVLALTGVCQTGCIVQSDIIPQYNATTTG